MLAELHGRARGRLGPVLDSLSPHPDPEARRALLGDTRALFRIGLWEAFGTGLAAAVAFPTLVSLLLMFLTGFEPDAFYLTGGQIAFLVAALLIGSVAAAILGLGVWRGAFIDLLEPTPSLHLGRLTLAFTAGLALGQWLSLSSGFEPAGEPANPFLLASAYLAWVAVLMLGIWLLLGWARSVGQAWLGVAMARGIGRPPYLPALVTLAVLLSAWLGVLLFVREIGSGATLVGDVGVLLGLALSAGVALQFMENPVSLVILGSLWTVPFASWLQRSRRTAPDWTYLDAASSPARVAAPLALRPAVMVALAGAAVFVLTDVLMYASLHLAVPAVQRSRPDYRVEFAVAQILLAALVQGYVGAGAAAQRGPLPVIRGLFAAYVAGALTTAALLAINLLAGGSISVSFLLLMLGLTVNLGALVALPLAAIVVALGRPQGEVPWLKPSIQT